MTSKVFLLADDDRDDTDMFREALMIIDKDIICHCATDGREALKILNELTENPDLIFLDVNMPIVNGWKCLKLLKSEERYKHLPVIIISTSSNQGELDIAANLGALGYFIKPNDFNELTKVLEVIVANLGIELENALRNLQVGGFRFVYAFTGDNKTKVNTN